MKAINAPEQMSVRGASRSPCHHVLVTVARRTSAKAGPRLALLSCKVAQRAESTLLRWRVMPGI